MSEENGVTQPKNLGEVLNIIEQNNPFQVMRVGQLAHDHWIRFFEVIKTMFRDLLKREKTKLTNKMKENNSCATIECKEGKIHLIGSTGLFKDDMILLSNIELIEKLGEGLI